ncbi:MAG: 4-hydroxybutyryl-CoA dehydratase [Chloroflexota bacterium]|nr:MAG: 4-hydroxybutyryl-CoA dehydratase [Chloroflexota bacterium]
MPLMTGEEYVESLRQLKPRVYALGERIESVVDSPLMRPHVNAAAMTYEAAHLPGLSELGSAISPLTGKRISRFTYIHQNTADLVTKVKLLRLLGQHTGTCFQRCVGFDGLNALHSVTYDIDQKHNTEYHQRFLDFLRYIQETDFMIDGAMTDPKGDRSLSPSKQPDPDQYVHVVERRPDGIVIRGAKIHQTGAVNSHQILVMPTSALRPEDADYAVACAVPVDAEGVILIFGRQSNDGRRLEHGEIDQGNARYGIVGGEATVVFDDVFVPWERVFMCGEYEFAGSLVERFTCYHRQNYGGCKAGVSDVIVGASATLAEYNGVANAAHVRDKLVEMVHLSESLYSGSIACSAEGTLLASNVCLPDPMLANTVKLNTTRFIYEIYRLAHDIAGGVIATLPSEQDLRHPEIGKWVEKYFGASAACTAELRIRIARLVENMTAGTALVESMHGAGSPQAERVVLYRQANLEGKKALAKRLAGIQDGSWHLRGQ